MTQSDQSDSRIERVAKALYDHWREVEHRGWGEWEEPDPYGPDEEQREHWRAMARVALQAASDDEPLSDPPPLDKGPLAHLHRAQVEAERKVAFDEEEASE